MKLNKIIVNESIELLDYLYNSIKDKSKNNIKSMLTSGYIYVNNKSITKYNYNLKPKDTIEIKYNIDGIDIIYEDKNIIVVNKPSGLLTISSEKEKEKTLYYLVSNYLKKINKNNKIFIIHRLDKDTSGVVMFAKNMNVKNTFQKNWNEYVKSREYTAVVEGITKNSGTITSYLKESNTFVYSSKNKDGKLAITHYTKVNSNDKYTLLNIKIDTGRKNQIRVAMKDIGNPIVGDKKYGSTKDPVKRLCLHHNKLVIYNPFEKKIMTFECKNPSIFSKLVKNK